MADCRYCQGTGDAGPVHVSFGDGRGEWREHMPCSDCLESVTRFWNTRADDWASDEIISLRVKLAQAESEARINRIERDRAMKACEQIAAAKKGAADAL